MGKCKIYKDIKITKGGNHTLKSIVIKALDIDSEYNQDYIDVVDVSGYGGGRTYKISFKDNK